MTLAGWIFMATSLTAVLSLVVWCYAKILGEDRASKQQTPPTDGGAA